MTGLQTAVSTEHHRHQRVTWMEMAGLMLVLAVYLVLACMSQSRLSWTVDEMRWIAAGKNIVENGWSDSNEEISHPLLFMKSQAVCRDHFSDGERDSEITFARLGLYPYVLFGLISLYIWSRSRHGIQAGFFSVLLLAFSPTFLAHARLATTDALLATAVLVTAMAFTRHFLKPSWSNGCLLTLAFGFGLLSKFSYLLIPVLLFPVVVCKSQQRIRFLIKIWVLPLLGSLILLNAVYGFKGTGQSMADLVFKSPILSRVASSPLGHVPVPLPDRYIKGMDIHLTFMGEWPSFFCGHVNMEGYPGYDLFAFVVKTTVPALILIIAGLLSRIWRRFTPADRIALYLATGWLLYFSFVHRVDCGVRYVLPVYPLLFFIAGRTTCIRGRGWLNGKWWGTGFVAVHIGITMMHYPFYINFFNAAAGGSKGGYRLLGDSNISWTQELKEVSRYQEENEIGEIVFGIEARLKILDPYLQYRPITHREKYLPRSGDYVIWVASLQSLLHRDPNAFLWFRLIEPDDIIGGAAYVYRVTVEPGTEMDFFRKALAKNRTGGFDFPWVETTLREQAGTMIFPLLGIPENDQWEETIFYTEGLPPAELIAVYPPEAAEDLTVTIVQGRETMTLRCMDTLFDSRAVYYLPDLPVMPRLIVRKTGTAVPPESISLVFSLEEPEMVMNGSVEGPLHPAHIACEIRH
jgi:4-amino-4-deoxy-L-arabinose transferase-like glycosyltransferase